MIEGFEPIRDRVESAEEGERGIVEEVKDLCRLRKEVMREITREEWERARR